mmetsp:Transcript_8523/g.18425  ORF Transcript_8523/g.18425 Transcript_8523/m.18425 type:complete len:619 (+) Transcript_8523:142-1998(+)|eukprot:CAMPEP_0183708696 /NCGR_PEP_ID=MMETSP0737-20130205/4915_1 /TAXON_ID=385413 /ORGANISM="Thalassiosira miniscula, Strain CCMP1093" /LENGTH=618 /DNA_ID=CAMNT_0025936605 /DNA_START=38 /DNA_END=1894 /DNA_ORIENTATION=+
MWSTASERPNFPGPAQPGPGQSTASGASLGPSQNGDEQESAPQNARRQSSPRQRIKRSPFSPSNKSPSSPSIRNSLSSRASDMGRRLAEERSKNEQLMQQIRELEDTVTLLRQGGHDNNTNNGSNNNPCSPSHPGTSPTSRTVNSSETESSSDITRRLQSLEEALGIETRRREAAEEKAARFFQRSDYLTINSDGLEVASGDFPVAKLLKQASTLLSGNVSPRKNNTESANATNSNQTMYQDGNGVARATTHTHERMHEYHDLVSAFHSEQESYGDIDGEELIPREDILWLFQELKLRFEDILSIYTDESSRNTNKEWRECLEGLSNVVKRAMQPYPLAQANNQQGDEEDTSELALSNDTRNLQNEVSSLNQRLASFAAQHNETCSSLYDDMEAMKRNYEEQITKKSQCIENLETKIKEQEELITQMQQETNKDKQWIEEEKEKLKLSKEGTSMRIRYLEGMLRSVQKELKDTKTPQSKNNNGTEHSTPIPTKIAAELKKEQALPSPPVFMRDLTSAMQAVEVSNNETNATNDFAGNEAKDERDTKRDAKTPPPKDAEITKLLDQIASLGNSLADSETRRANLLDDFQTERKKYILQYKQMSDVLKQLIIEERIEHHS